MQTEDRFTSQGNSSHEPGFIERTVDERSTDWGRQLQSTSDSFRQTANLLRGFGLRPPAQIAETLAEYARNIGSYLETSNASTLLRDMEGLARRQPAIVIGASLVAGIVGARILKASQQVAAREQEQRDQMTSTVGSGEGEIDVDNIASGAIREPLGPALIASAGGFIVSLLIPMGEGEMTRWSSVSEKVRADEVMERGQRILEETKKAAAHVAREQAEELAENLMSS
jgi:hypothetical protein